MYFIQILTMGLGAYLVVRGHLTVGAVVAFVALLLNVANAANHLSSVMPDLLQASGGMQRVREFLAEEPTVREARDARTAPRLSHHVCFEDVSFGYRANAIALRNVSFRVAAGESVAVVGPSGSGKSTILNLILRLYDPDAGRIERLLAEEDETGDTLRQLLATEQLIREGGRAPGDPPRDLRVEYFADRVRVV